METNLAKPPCLLPNHQQGQALYASGLPAHYFSASNKLASQECLSYAQVYTTVVHSSNIRCSLKHT